MSNLLAELNDKQIEAVRATEGPVLVIAGAGSGKTRTLTHRIAYLIREKQVPAHGVLAVTFTNKAAAEMRNRAAGLLRQNPNTWQTWRGFKAAPALGTFHSICARILRENADKLGFGREFAIYDSYDQKQAMKAVLGKNNISIREVNPSTALAILSRAKNELVSPTEFSEQTRGPIEERVALLYADYQDWLKRNNAMDFDDLLFKTVELFLKAPEVLAGYQNHWQYLMIDEYQDTNHAQYIWAKMLSDKNRNIFAVGDDWQGIYSWRGATIRNILEFERDFPGARVIALEQNYRSPAEIVELGNAIIAGNRAQMKKKLWTERVAGQKPQAILTLDETDEAEEVLRQIAELEGITTPNPSSKRMGNSSNPLLSKEGQGVVLDEITYDYEAEGGGGILDKILGNFKKANKSYSSYQTYGKHGNHFLYKLKDAGIDWNKYVVLYRTNAQSRVLEETMLRYGVPYRLIGGVRFYERKEIKDTLAYLRFLFNPNDFVSLVRIINEPSRGIGDKTLGLVQRSALDKNQSFLQALLGAEKIAGVSSARSRALQKFADLFARANEKINDLTLLELIDFLLKRADYLDYLKSLGEEGKERMENIGELKNVASKFSRLNGRAALSAFLEEVALVADIDNYDPTASRALTLMTLHSAKGLEFDAVFIVGMEEGLLPHSGSLIDPQELEEERRLCYVGITRARKHLYFLYTRTRSLFGSISGTVPSRFLGEMGEGVEYR